MSGYVLSAAAALDLDGIWDYIAADSIDAADRWIGRLFDAFEALGRSPISVNLTSVVAEGVVSWVQPTCR